MEADANCSRLTCALVRQRFNWFPTKRHMIGDSDTARTSTRYTTVCDPHVTTDRSGVRGSV
ncbi:hypothetical protein GCM10018772_10500 [Streptomyces fumanus]|uniref:Uncharacterized protein n=1 Tax=Streptomyces fumanus TaxID=67302 RepID=A0A919A5E8_9ACTN|nr:hypothetical protein GCM10018772_10500 [Streptomyces fumanus]